MDHGRVAEADVHAGRALHAVEHTDPVVDELQQVAHVDADHPGEDVVPTGGDDDVLRLVELGQGAIDRGELAFCVLAGGMAPEKIGARVVEAIEAGEYWIFTHPEWKAMAELVTQDMLASFGPSPDPAYKGDDIDGLIAANGGRMFGARV